MKKFAAWWLAIRPKTLTVSIVPVCVGTALAYFERGTFVWWPALAALLAAMLIQIGTNLYNDVGDFERGADTAERLVRRVRRRRAGYRLVRYDAVRKLCLCWRCSLDWRWQRGVAGRLY